MASHICRVTAVCIAVLVCARELSAQVTTHQIVADLASVGGVAPMGGVIKGADGALYGTTSEGGLENCGMVYRLDAAGQLSRILDFGRQYGCRPVGELALGSDGGLYGVTSRGGNSDSRFPDGVGTIYKIAANGEFTVLHRFNTPVVGPEEYLEPYLPDAGLTLGPDGFFYGTLQSSDVYRISPEGAFELIRQFQPGEPLDLQAAVLFGADGYLYSTSLTFEIPSASTPLGIVFRVSLAGEYELLRAFLTQRDQQGGLHADQGGVPSGELAIGPDGELYGANSRYGPSFTTDRGTLFRRDPDGTFRVLHVFSQGANQSYPDGAGPVGGLILGTDGQIYGRTLEGGATGNGTVFRVSPDGVFTMLRSFPQDGYTQTRGRLLETSPGVFFGTARSATGGVVYRVAVSSSFGVSLVAPIGGDKHFVGVPTTIAWSASGAATIDVEVSRNGGRSFEPISECAGLPGASTSCTWTPTARTARAQIRVIAHDAAGGMASDVSGNFRISQAPPRVRILVPHGAAQLTAFRTYQVWWSHNLGAHSAVRIEVSADGGTTWGVLASSVVNLTPQAGMFDWFVAIEPPTDSALLRITSLSTGTFDISNRSFQIVSHVPPNGQ